MGIKKGVDATASCDQKERAFPDVTELTRNVGFLLGRARLSLSSRTNKRLMANLGVSSAQANVLFLIGTNRSASMKAIALGSGMDMASTSRLVTVLEERGLITRVRSDSDRRVLELQLTRSGREVAVQFPKILHEVVDSALTTFAEDRKAALREMLEEMIVNCVDGRREAHVVVAAKANPLSSSERWLHSLESLTRQNEDK
ncbi:DNA-binding MarR family transcriptional regulator [Paraburkholderia sp. GAS199]|uniref:MarR family winged helix-turn-helix transcriptional regulator n=1 Tax=Paraburkholderia sp. GAS199 TaxID=3035126 RepID=UPI003D250356